MMDSTTLAVIDAVGAAAVLTAAQRTTGVLQIALYGFGAYAAYGAYMHATGSIRITRARES